MSDRVPALLAEVESLRRRVAEVEGLTAVMLAKLRADAKMDLVAAEDSRLPVGTRDEHFKSGRTLQLAADRLAALAPEAGRRVAEMLIECQERLARERQRNAALLHQVEELQYELNQVRP